MAPVTPQPKPRFFSFPHPMNSSVARVVGAGVVLMAVATIVLDQPWITLVLSFGYIARVAAGPRISPLAILASKVIVPKLGLPYRPVAGPPKRFAATIGSTFSVSAAILSLIFGETGIAYIVLGGLIIAAALESIFDFCLGCQIFSILMRIGVIPESVCEDCANFSQRAKRMAA
ncbi:MAG: DUF4395 domain-containing protein, partial [Chloroflexi bacterium]|nr:DUF4395 domain-containing protein [Chloroflexota bacterium]